MRDVAYRIEHQDDEGWKPYATARSEASARAVLSELREAGVEARAVRVVHDEQDLNW